MAMSEYERIRAKCLKGNKLWEDPDFPAVQTSVFYHETPPFMFQWKRPRELSKDAVFINDLPDKFRVSPGKLGDPWFVSCLGSLFMCKGLFYRVVPADQGFNDAKNSDFLNNTSDVEDEAIDEVISHDDTDLIPSISNKRASSGVSSSSSGSSSAGKRKLNKKNGGNRIGYSGVFRFRIWWCGNWEEVLVDDRLPTVGNKLVFIHAGSGNEFWPSLLEKAYAKLHGSYEALKYGTALDGLGDLTGGAAENLKLAQITSPHLDIMADRTNNNSLHSNGSKHGGSKVDLHRMYSNGSRSESLVPATASLITHLLGMTSVVTAVVEFASNRGKGQKEALQNGILIGINYRVSGIQKVETYDGDFVQLVLLAAPSVPDNYSSINSRQNGHHELDPALLYDGLWSRGSVAWNDVPPEEQKRIGLGELASEEFWMSLPDFVKTFTHLEMVHLDHETSKDEETLQGCRPWQMRSHHGVWQKGVTAGGCRNNADTFHLNPQMLLGLAERQEAIISVSQHAILEPKVVGFSLYQLNPSSTPSSSQQKFVACTREYFRKHKSFFNSEYTNSRQVSARLTLEAGHYVILPTTFEPGQESSFTLRVYSPKLFKLRVLDTPSALVKPAIVKAEPSLNGSFSQYEAVFLQLADEHMTVNAFELQELLDACLPNDYVKSCASLDICRQVVIAMDRDGRGRLKFSDFKDFLVSLKSWQGAFRAHTKEKMGILRAERLKDALQHVGYQLSREILSVIAMRYTRKDGTLRFGDFVSAVLRLSMAFSLFERRQITQPNTLNISQDEWVKMALMC